MTVYLSLGSNHGDRAAALRAAIAALPSVGARVLRVSPIIETKPIGASGRAHFLNCVVEASTTLLPQVLLRRLLALERRLGRRRPYLPGSRKPPRPLDIDLILYGKARIHTHALTVPHPRAAQRPFVCSGLSALGVDRGVGGIHRVASPS